MAQVRQVVSPTRGSAAQESAMWVVECNGRGRRVRRRFAAAHLLPVLPFLAVPTACFCCAVRSEVHTFCASTEQPCLCCFFALRPAPLEVRDVAPASIRICSSPSGAATYQNIGMPLRYGARRVLPSPSTRTATSRRYAAHREFCSPGTISP